MPRGERAARGRRKAFTLVEILLIGGFSVGLLALLYGGFLTGSRQSRKLELDQQSVHALQILVEALHEDLAEAWTAVDGSPDPFQGLTPGLPGPEFRFLRRHGEEEPRLVEYRFDGASGRVERNGRPLSPSGFEHVTFRIIEEGEARILELVVSYSPTGTFRSPGTGEPARRVFRIGWPLDPPAQEPEFPWAVRG